MRMPTIAIFLLLALAIAAGGCGSSSSSSSVETGAEEQTSATSDTTEAAPSTSTTPSTPEAPVGVRATPCADSTPSGSMLRVTGVSCKTGRAIASGWYKDDACRPSAGASRSSCPLGAFLCLSAVAGRGIVVTCAAPDKSVAFIARRS